jgi:hypothetical protein
VSLKPLLCALATVAALAARPAAGRDVGDPIRLAWVEGDVAGMTSIFSADGKSTIGFVGAHRPPSHGSRDCETLRDSGFASNDGAGFPLEQTISQYRQAAFQKHIPGT